jgi:hypothetical protein
MTRAFRHRATETAPPAEGQRMFLHHHLGPKRWTFELTASLVPAHAWLWIAACYRLGGFLSVHVYDRRA